MAALTTRIVQLIDILGTLLGQLQEMPEACPASVYFLVGDDQERAQPSVYGPTGLMGKRLNEHHLDPRRDFWNRAVVAISLSHSVTQTHELFIKSLVKV